MCLEIYLVKSRDVFTGDETDHVIAAESHLDAYIQGSNGGDVIAIAKPRYVSA